MGWRRDSGRDGNGSGPGVDLGRRRILQFGGVGAVLTAVPVSAAPPDQSDPPIERGSIQPKRSGPKPSLVTYLRRREDQLNVRYEFWNLELHTTGNEAYLSRKLAGKDAHVVVHFLPQHVLEEAFYETSDLGNGDFPPPPTDSPGTAIPANQPPFAPPVGSRLAGESRLAFRVPDAITQIPFTADDLLAWDLWEPAVVSNARPSTKVQPLRGRILFEKLRPPTQRETAIELPWWLLVSPHAQTGWAHSIDAVEHDGRTELWHTRLAGKAPDQPLDEGDADRKTIRAIWARDPNFDKHLKGNYQGAVPDGEDFDQHPIGMPFRASLSPRDRFDIVTSTSDYSHELTDVGYLPEPAQVDRLMLTSLGGWLDAHAAWDALPGTGTSNNSLESWRHDATMGRDHYVRIVRSGFLFPFGHGASLIKVTERKFRTIGSGGRGDPKQRVAYLFQRYFIVVRQPTVTYGGLFQEHVGRRFPFTQLRCTTRITPTLDPPGSGGGAVGDPPFQKTMAFRPDVGAAPFLFEMVGTDRAGHGVDLSVPTIFVDAEIGTNANNEMAALGAWYNDLDETSPTRAVDVHGQVVAPATPEEPGDTDLEVHRLTLGYDAPVLAGNTDDDFNAAKQPGFFPAMSEAEIRLAAAEAALGGPLAGGLPVIVLNQNWVEEDFDGDNAGPGEVFVQLKDTNNSAQLNFAGSGADSGDRSGGVVAPNIGITALSRKTGTVAGPPEQFDSGDFTPADFFGALNANLIGDISLADVISELTNFDLSTDDKNKVLQISTRDEATAVVTRLDWNPDLVDFPATGNDKLFTASLGNTPATLSVQAVMTIPKDGSEGTSTITGDLQHFVVGLLPGARFLAVQFDRLRFQAETGKKTDVDVEIREVLFDGPLRFVNEFKDYMSFSSGGFSIELLPTHLAAGFELPLPSITVGVFSLQNLTFAAGATIPFTGQPVRFRFGFNTVDNPFLISVMIFGGGGFFELAIGPDGVESFQAALEFGCMAALDFGVASGSISITAGIYLAIGVENPPDNPDGLAELTGFIKLKGEVEVLGIISLGILMKASFTYIAPPVDKAIVKSVIVVEIDVLVFSGSVEIEYERRFGGSDDPTFGQSLTEANWTDYTAAFAPIGA